VRIACTSADEARCRRRRAAQPAGGEAVAESDGSELSREALALLELRDPAALVTGMPLLARAASAWATALAGRSRAPLLLLDDCERMDTLSRSIARAVVLDRGGAGMRWVWAGRTGAAAGQEEDRILVRAGQASELAIGALDRAGAVRLAAARLHLSPPEELTEYLWGRSGGHPGLLVESLRAAAERGALREGDAGLEVDGAALESLPMPAGFEQSLLDRLAALPARARETAEVLAALDRPAQPAELQVLVPGADEPAIGSLLSSGVAARDGQGALGLRPPELSRRLLESLDEPRREALHRLVLSNITLLPSERFRHLAGAGDTGAALAAAAEALESHADERVAVRAARLAEAAAPAAAAHWSETAGRLLHERGRHREAVPHLERALEGTSDAGTRARLWLLLSSALLRADRPEDVGHVVARALADAPPPHERALLQVNHASQLFSRGLLPEAEAAARSALDLAEQSVDAEASGYAALTLASIWHSLGRMEDADELAARSTACFERAQQVSGAVRSLSLRATIAGARRDGARAGDLLREALGRARAGGLRLATEEILVSQTALFVESGRWKEGEQALGEALRLALQDGRPRGVAVAYANLALLDALSGRPSRARRRARTAHRLMRAYLPRLEPFACRVLAQAYRSSGRLAAAERAARAAISGAIRLGLGAELEWARLEYGRIRAVTGAWTEAEAVWDTALAAAGERAGQSVVLLAVASGRAHPAP
jgi:tetratricopeptide (TPR) repeat protein